MSRLRLALPLVAAMMFAAPVRAEEKSVPVGGACKSDAQCAIGSICTDGVCTALSKARKIIPFYWHKPGEVGSLHVPIVLYFSTWDREKKTAVQFPWFAHTRNYVEKSSTTIIPPLLFWAGRYEGRGSQVGWMPFFYFQRKGPQKWLVLPPLLSGGQRNEREDLTEAVVALVGYYRRHHDDAWRVFFPLVWDHETKNSRTTVALPLGYFHRGDHTRTDVLFPLVWHFANHELGTDHFLFLPLFDIDSDHNGHRQRLISLVAAWERNDDAKLRQLVLFAPPVFHRRDSLRDVDVVPPLFVRWRVHDDNSSGLIAFPFVHSSDPEGSTTALFPVFWRFWDRKANAETDILFPVLGVHRSPTTTGAFVGPVYGWRSRPTPARPEGGWGGGVAPVAMFGRTGTRSHTLVLPPLFERFANSADGSSTTLVGPVFHHTRANHGGWDAGLFPVLWFGADHGRGYAIVPPLFFHRATREATTTVVGPLYFKKYRTGWSAGLAPLFFFGHHDGQSHQVVLPPLFIHTAGPGRDRLLAGPYFHRRDGDARVDALFPLFYLRRAPDDGLLIGPLAGWRKTPTGETIVGGPYIYRRNDLTQSRTHVFLPLFIKHDAPNYHVLVQFPFFWRVHEGNEVDTTIFPLYFGVRSPERKIDVIPLLGFLHARTNAAKTTVVGPFWWRARYDGGRQGGLFPLFAYGRMQKDDKASSWFGMPGAFWSKNDFTGTSKLWAGLFYRETHDSGWSAGLIPLVFAWKRGTATKVVTPIYYRQADAAADYALNVLGPLWWGHTAETKRFGLFPLTFARWKPDGTFATGLFPVFYFQKKHLGSVFATLVFGWSKYPTGWRAYVGPLYLRRDEQRASTTLFPIFYYSKNHVTGGSTGFLLPLWLDTRGGDGRQLQAYTPLVWRYHSVERTVIVGLPLLVDIHNFAESRSTAVLPFLVRHRTDVDHYTEWAFPPILTWVRKHHDTGATDFAFFPLVWRFGGQNSTTVVAPLYWDFKRGNSRTTVLFPIFAHWKREDADHTLFLNMYYRRGRGPYKEGSWYVDVFPLAEFGRPRKHDVTWKVLEGLFGYSRLGRNRILHLFWFIDIALEPAPASSLTWWSNTPPSARTEF